MQTYFEKLEKSASAHRGFVERFFNGENGRFVSEFQVDLSLLELVALVDRYKIALSDIKMV
jgi:hypothetical protein